MSSGSQIDEKRPAKGGSDVLLQFSPLVTGHVKRSLVTYIGPHSASAESLQAGVLLVASTRADVRRQFINRLCEASVERSALVYSIAPYGGVNVDTEGVYKLSTHPTLSRRAILNALLRHGAHLLVFGTISTRDDVMALMDAAYTGYHCVAEIYGESAHDVLSRLEAIGIDISILPQNLRIVVPATTE
ncbi:protein transport protein HofB [Acrasis kona]|uniref:Protein transport protein HofB n=1 Tax=Acrasis kona TaxID=1008807 RepID=A0AAW2ZKX2_9EUKA